MMRYIKPGSPWENACIESFHDKLRDECLNREVFGRLAEARIVIEQWRPEYNDYQPHSSLEYGTPAEAAARCQNTHGLISLRSMRPSLRLTVLENTPTSSVQGGWTYIYDLSHPMRQARYATMNATQRLLEEADKVRIYKTQNGRWAYSAERFLSGIAARHPDLPLHECYREVEHQTTVEDRIQKIAVRHACVRGKADIRELEDYIGQKLPEDLARFYDCFMEAALLFRHPIQIFSPAGIVECERIIREAEMEAGCEVPHEVAILRFAHVEVFAASFALRKFQDGVWRVIVWGGFETTAELQDSANEQNEFHVESFDEWLVRLLDTDGFPLSPFDPDFFRPPVAERIE